MRHDVSHRCWIHIFAADQRQGISYVQQGPRAEWSAARSEGEPTGRVAPFWKGLTLLEGLSTLPEGSPSRRERTLLEEFPISRLASLLEGSPSRRVQNLVEGDPSSRVAAFWKETLLEGCEPFQKGQSLVEGLAPFWKETPPEGSAPVWKGRTLLEGLEACSRGSLVEGPAPFWKGTLLQGLGPS